MERVAKGHSAAVDTPREWRDHLTWLVSGLMLFAFVSGLAIYLLPFSAFPQLILVLHVIAGAVMIPLTVGYAWRHWRRRRGGNLSH